MGIDVTKQSWYQNLVGFTQQGGKGGTGNGTTRTSQTYSNAQEKAQNKEEESKKGDDDKTKEDDEKKKAAAEKAKRRREAEERQHLIDKQNKAEKKRERDEQLERDTLVVQAMRDGNEKKLAQIDINYRKEQNAIADWEEKLRQDAINNAKALWEKDPNSKGARDAGQTFWTTEKYKELSGEGFKLTETETQLKANKLQVAELNRINELLKLSNHYETDFQKLNEETLTIMGDIAAMENTRKKLIQIISENANKETEEAKEAVARAKEYNDKLQERIQYAKLLKKYQGFNEGGEYDFFAKYGSSSIRKRAIEEKANVEIDLDMANGKMGKALSEVLERNKDMAEVDAEKTKAVFAEMFSDIENLSVKALEKLHDNASNALKKTKDATQAKEIADRIKEIDERIAELKMPLHQFSIYTEDYYRAVVLAEQASKRLKDSEDRKKNIEDEIESNSTSLNEKLGKIGYTGSVELTPENISKMQEAINKSNATEDQKRTIIELIAEAVKLSKELEDAQQAINENTEAVNRAEANRDASKQSKFLNNYGIKKRKDEETGDTEYEVDWQRALAKIQQDLGNLGNIFSELSIGGEDAQNAIAGLSSGVGAAASFMSGDYVGAALQGVQAIKSFGKALGIGGGNARAVAEITERLTQENERLRKSIEGLTDEMSKTKGGFKSIEAAEKAIELQQKINKNQNEILNAQSGYHSSHHSNDYYINKEFRSGDWGKISSIVGESVRNAYELTMLSPEKLAKIRTNEYDLWKKIVTTGKYNKEEYWDAVADLGDKVNNLEEQLKETLTSTTFDSMYDGFLSTLKEMTGSAQKFSDDFSEMLFDAVINNYAANEFSEKIQKIYDEMSADLRKQGGSLSKSQMDAYKERYKVLGEQAQETVEMLAQMTGYDSIANQSGSTKSFAGMSAEKGDAMEGRLTAIQIAVEGIKAKVYDTPDLSTPLEQLGLSMSNIGTIADENRSILAKSYLCLLEINDNTKSVVQPIKQMAVDIAKIKTNTNKL